MPGLVTIQLNQNETRTLLAMVQARNAELARMIQGMEEGEGMDAARHNALKTLRPQQEALTDLQLKLEGANKEF